MKRDLIRYLMIFILHITNMLVIGCLGKTFVLFPTEAGIYTCLFSRYWLGDMPVRFVK